MSRPKCNEKSCPTKAMTLLGKKYDPNSCIFKCQHDKKSCHNLRNKEFDWKEWQETSGRYGEGFEISRY